MYNPFKQLLVRKMLTNNINIIIQRFTESLNRLRVDKREYAYSNNTEKIKALQHPSLISKPFMLYCNLLKRQRGS